MTSVSAGPQIPLAFSKFEQIDFELFEAGNNQQLVEQLKSLSAGEDKNNLYLWGPAGSGKSHLMQALCNAAAGHELAVVYIPLSESENFTPAMLEGLENLDLVCLDDVDGIAGNAEWEQALFHLFNRMRDEKTPMVVTACESPRGSSIVLKDLSSRLAWDLVFHIESLNEEESLRALKKRADARGFDLPDEIASYLLRRVSRDMHSLFKLLDGLDRASLVAKKKLTIPFVKNLLDE